MYLLKVNFTKKLTFRSAASNKHDIKSLNVDIHFQKIKKEAMKEVLEISTHSIYRVSVSGQQTKITQKVCWEVDGQIGSCVVWCLGGWLSNWVSELMIEWVIDWMSQWVSE